MEYINEPEIIVTDEVLLLKEKLSEAQARISNLTRERDAALQRSEDLARNDRNTHRLLEMMTQKVVRYKTALAEQQRKRC